MAYDSAVTDTMVEELRPTRGQRAMAATKAAGKVVGTAAGAGLIKAAEGLVLGFAIGVGLRLAIKYLPGGEVLEAAGAPSADLPGAS